MGRSLRFVRDLGCLAALVCAGRAQNIELKTAANSPMQYYLSLPQGWAAGKRWPVAIVIESARRDFLTAAKEYSAARGAMPFILAAPMVVTGGGAGYRQVETYRYSEADWAAIEKAGGCKFDADGIGAVVKDIAAKYGGEEKYFLASWEAGGHTGWAEVFGHPETLRAAAFSGPNYQGRCVEFSQDPARAKLPVKVFLSGVRTNEAPNLFVHQQSARAKDEGEQHGFRAMSLVEIADKPHGPMPEEVLAWFSSLLH